MLNGIKSNMNVNGSNTKSFHICNADEFRTYNAAAHKNVIIIIIKLCIIISDQITTKWRNFYCFTTMTLAFSPRTKDEAIRTCHFSFEIKLSAVKLKKLFIL